MRIKYIKDGTEHIDYLDKNKKYSGCALVSVQLDAGDNNPKTIERLKNFFLPRLEADRGKSWIPKPEPKLITADGEEFQIGELYFYFDRTEKQVFSGRWEAMHARPAEGVVYHAGFRIDTRRLYRNRNDALEDGKRIFQSEIERSQFEIKRLEAEQQSEPKA